MAELKIDELDFVIGGDDNYKECVLGSKAGGPAGMYPFYVPCNEDASGSSFGSSMIKGGIKGGAHGAT
jgi:hypothetical protein